MFLTKADIQRLPEKAFTSPYEMIVAVSTIYSCGISHETAVRIINDFKRNQG